MVWRFVGKLGQVLVWLMWRCWWRHENRGWIWSWYVHCTDEKYFCPLAIRNAKKLRGGMTWKSEDCTLCLLCHIFFPLKDGEKIMKQKTIVFQISKNFVSKFFSCLHFWGIVHTWLKPTELVLIIFISLELFHNLVFISPLKFTHIY